jgi:hypothetical protein
VFSFTDMFDFLMNEFSGLSRGRLSLELRLAGPFNCFSFGLRFLPNPRLTRLSGCRRILPLVLILSKLLIVVALVGLLRCSEHFRSMSRQLDEQAFAVLRRIMSATEDCGYPPQLIPLLILLTAVSFMLSVYFTVAAGR